MHATSTDLSKGNQRIASENAREALMPRPNGMKRGLFRRVAALPPLFSFVAMRCIFVRRDIAGGWLQFKILDPGGLRTIDRVRAPRRPGSRRGDKPVHNTVSLSDASDEMSCLN